MSVFLFVYGTEHHCVRVGFSGSRPLVYAVYAYNIENELPSIVGQTYLPITRSQYEWIRNHIQCDVSFISGEWIGRKGNLECRSCGVHYQLFADLDPVNEDLWDEREV